MAAGRGKCKSRNRALTRLCLRDGMTATAAGSTEIRLAELLGALSHALDMTEGQPAGHCVRCCWIGMHIGREIGLDEARALGALLHAAAQGPRLQQQRGAHLPALPDRRPRLQARRQDDRRQPAAGAALRPVAHRPQGRARRALSRAGQRLPEQRRDRPRADRDALPSRRRHRAQDALLRSRRARHPEPRRALGRRRPAARRCAATTSRSTRASRCWRRSSTCSSRQRRRGGATPRSRVAPAPGSIPQLVGGVRRGRRRGRSSGTTAARRRLQQAIFALEPAQQSSSSTRTTSTTSRPPSRRSSTPRAPTPAGTASASPLFTDLIAEQLGFAPERRRWLKRARAAARYRQARRQQLDPRQAGQARRRRMGGDAACTPRTPRRSSSRIAAFAELAAIAGAHHERLDGKGYPRGLAGDADRARDAHHHHRRHLRRADRRPPLSRRDAGDQGAGDHDRHGRHADR